MSAALAIQFVVILLVAGSAAGVLAGLLGVGGGIVLVPAFLVVLELWGYSGTGAMQIAVATSLATIIVTSSRSVRAHWTRGAVDMALLKRLAPAVAVGALAGMGLAQIVESVHLQAIFGAIGSCVGLYMMLAPSVARPGATLPRPPITTACAGVFGMLSALIGIGGGSFFVPFLTYFGRGPHQAVATSAGMGVVIAVPAVIGFLLVPTAADAPPLTVGQVNLAAAGVVVCATVLCAPLGARLAHWLNPALLKRVFGGFLILTAGRMLIGAIGAL